MSIILRVTVLSVKSYKLRKCLQIWKSIIFIYSIIPITNRFQIKYFIKRKNSGVSVWLGVIGACPLGANNSLYILPFNVCTYAILTRDYHG
jgi:hypothetical protein